MATSVTYSDIEDNDGAINEVAVFLVSTSEKFPANEMRFHVGYIRNSIVGEWLYFPDTEPSNVHVGMSNSNLNSLSLKLSELNKWPRNPAALSLPVGG